MLDKPKVQSRMYSPEKYATSGTIYRTMKQTQNTAPKTKKMNNIVRQTKRKTKKTHIHKSKDGGEPSSFRRLSLNIIRHPSCYL